MYVCVLQWHRPRVILGYKVFDYGAESKEKATQKQREQGVLQALFFGKLPDNPLEADFVTEEHEDSKTIPLDDVRTGFLYKYWYFHFFVLDAL